MYLEKPSFAMSSLGFLNKLVYSLKNKLLKYKINIEY